MRISDWSSDVCSSDLLNEQSVRRFEQDAEFAMGFTFFACVALLPLLCFIVYRKMKPKMEAAIELFEGLAEQEERTRKVEEDVRYQIGRASCRERVCQYVQITVVAESVKKKNQD